MSTGVAQVYEKWYNTRVVNLIKAPEEHRKCSPGFDTRKDKFPVQPHSNSQLSFLKTCSRCGETKFLADFVIRRSGRKAGKYEAYCKKCNKLARRGWGNQNRDHIFAYNAENRQRFAEKTVQSKKRHPERLRAGDTVRHAVYRGKFPPAWTMVCEECQEAQASHYHHYNGYAREHRLDVIALCTECHGKAHWNDK